MRIMTEEMLVCDYFRMERGKEGTRYEFIYQ